ncbi:MAG: long-chain fatty acid--CoA ligase [Ktedonobacter sp. 13_1_20CM_3_54_15]|nr:MAG: long-chain fatty acid--CoA ligase [Ktedonobacter sp. 13_1_20CM_3_54_15]
MTDRHFAFWPRRVPHSLTLPETNVYYNLEVSATRYPEKTAMVYYGSEISYRRLAEEVNRFAGYLTQLGIGRGDRILLYMQNSPQFVIAYYAILRANAAVVPLNPMYVTEELRYYVQDSEARVAFVGQEVYDRIAPLLGQTPLKHVFVATYSDYLAPHAQQSDIPIPDIVAAARKEIQEEGAILWSEALQVQYGPRPLTAGPDDLAVLPYTSGTTGKPKGCMHTHHTVQATLVGAGVWTSMTPNAVILTTLPLFHVTGMQHSMNAPIFNGSSFVLMTRWDREVAAQLIQRYGCTHWTNISTMVIDFLANPKIRDYDLHTLMLVGGGGAPLPEAVGERLYELLGLRYMEGYGLSETISQTHFNPPDRPKLQCLGVPSFDVDARVIDPETLEELGPNQVGEIVCSGPQVLRGYWRRPEETEEVFLTRDGKRFLRTGDLGQYDDEGYYFMVDRLKRMINASGFKVWPAEVESILYNHPAIQEACVIGMVDPRRGETVKAFVVVRQEQRGMVSEEEIIEWSKGQMAAYKYPRMVQFVDALPRSGTGKILWRQLQEQERASASQQ